MLVEAAEVVVAVAVVVLAFGCLVCSLRLFFAATAVVVDVTSEDDADEDKFKMFDNDMFAVRCISSEMMIGGGSSSAGENSRGHVGDASLSHKYTSRLRNTPKTRAVDPAFGPQRNTKREPKRSGPKCASTAAAVSY